jgi:hypothetical protein
MAEHPKNQSGHSQSDNLVKPGSTMDPKGGATAQQGMQNQQDIQNLKQGQAGQNLGQSHSQQGQQGAWPQNQLSEQDQKQMQERQQQAWDDAAEREKSNNPATKQQREYGKDAPGMDPHNQPAPDTKLYKATRLDLEDITGNPGHRGVNPDAPANSINKDRNDSINEPRHIDQNWPQRGGQGGYTPGQQQGSQAGQQNIQGGSAGSINEPAGSQVIPPGAGGGTGEEVEHPPGSLPGSGQGESEEPVIDELEPDEVKVGSPDTTLRVHGSGFVQGSVIQFGPDNDLQTEFVSDSELSAQIKPSEWGEGVVPVRVKNADSGQKSEEVEFEFLAETPTQTKRTKPKPKGKKR